MEKDLNEVIEIPSSNGQEEKVDEPVKEEVQTEAVEESPEKESEETPKEEVKEETKTEEDIEALPEWAKTRLQKLENDKENYKKGMLKYKKYSLTPEKTEEKVSEVKEEVLSVIGQTNEKTAISKFLADHPEAEDKWDDIVFNYSAKNGKETVDSVYKDLDRAYLLTRYESGDLNKLQEEASKKGEKAGVAKAKLAEMSSVSKTSSKTVPKGTTLSPGALNLASKMRVDAKKLAQEDDSLTAEINF